MPTVNEKLADAATSHAVDLTGYSNGVVRRIIGLLNRSDARLFAELTQALDTMSPESFTVERLESLLLSVRQLNLQAYQQIERELTQELRELVQYEASYQLQLFQSVIPAQVIATVGVSAVNAEQVYAAALSRPFQGALLREFSQRQEAIRMGRIRDTIRMGYVENRTTQEIVRQLRGTRAKGYSDGIIELDRRQTEAIVRTAISHTAGFTRDRFYEANGDIIKAVVWVSTLDARTSSECRVRDGLKYGPIDHKPIGHSVPWLGGPGRLHWNAVPAGTLIATASGQRPIDSLRAGDMVLTHRGRFRPVLDVRSKLCEGGVVRAAHTEAGRVLRATDDHPIATATGWKFMGALEVGEQLLGDPECLEEVVGAVGQVGSKAKNRPASRDDTGVSLNRTLQLVAAAVDLECNAQVGASEVEDRVLSLVLGNPERIEDQCLLHHLLATADALKKLGRHRLGDLLSNMYGHRGAAESFRGALEGATLKVGSPNLLGNTGHVDWVPCGHSFGVPSEGSVSFLGEAPRPMVRPSGCNAAATLEVEDGLLFLGSDRNVVASSARGQASVCQTLAPLDVAQRSAGANVLLDDERAEDRIFFRHDRVIALELQYYDSTVYDLEIAEDASYIASGIAVSNCRSSSAPVTRSWRELGIDLDEMDAGTRASMDGQVPAEQTYNQWLAKQLASRQDEVLGPTRGKLFRQGGLPMDRFYNDKGVFLDLPQLRERDARAFAKAGL